MIDLHYAPTPNGWKISIMLEELGLPYKVIPVNIRAGEQFRPEFLVISPNNRPGFLRGACHRARVRATRWLCAEYERQLGGGSPLSSLMTAKDQRSARASSRGGV